MIYKREIINDVEEFLDRLVLHAAREVSVYLFILCQNRLDYYLDYTSF